MKKLIFRLYFLYSFKNGFASIDKPSVYYIKEFVGTRTNVQKIDIETEGEARFASLWNLNIFEEWKPNDFYAARVKVSLTEYRVSRPGRRY